MKKAVVIGCPGIGTHEFGKKLSKNTGIPYHDINEAYLIKEEDINKNSSFHDRELEMINKSAWIIVGNYVDSLEMRFKECDTIFFFDYPLQLCRNLNAKKLATGIPNGVVARFHREARPEILKMLERYSEKNIFTFKTEDEKDFFINSLCS